MILSILTRASGPRSSLTSQSTLLDAITRLKADLASTVPLASLEERYGMPVLQGLNWISQSGLPEEAQVLYEFSHGFLLEGQRLALERAVGRVIDTLKSADAEVSNAPEDPERTRSGDTSWMNPDWNMETPWFTAWLRQSSQIEDFSEMVRRLRSLRDLLESGGQVYTRNIYLEQYEGMKAWLREIRRLEKAFEALGERQRLECAPTEKRLVLRDVRSLFSEISEGGKGPFIATSTYAAFRQKYSQGEVPPGSIYRSLPPVNYRALETFLGLPRKQSIFVRYPFLEIPMDILSAIPMGIFSFVVFPFWVISIHLLEGLISFHDKAMGVTSDVGALAAMAEKGRAPAFRCLFDLAEGGSAEAKEALAGLGTYSLRSSNDPIFEGMFKRPLFNDWFRLAEKYGNWRALVALNRQRTQFSTVDDLLQAVSSDNPILIASILAGGREALEALEEIAIYYPNIREIVSRVQEKAAGRVRVLVEKPSQETAPNLLEDAEEETSGQSRPIRSRR